MVQETILQHWVFSNFAFPFFLVFFVLFAILEKTKLLGESKQLNAMVAGVIGLIFVSAVFPKIIVGNLMQFLTVAIMVVFVGLLLWGFVSGSEEPKVEGKLKTPAIVVTIIAVIIGTLWAAQVNTFGVLGDFAEFLFSSSWSNSFWSNALFIIVIALAMAVALGAFKATGGGGDGDGE